MSSGEEQNIEKISLEKSPGAGLQILISREIQVNCMQVFLFCALVHVAV